MAHLFTDPVEVVCPRCGAIHDMSSLELTAHGATRLRRLALNEPVACGKTPCVACGFVMVITLEVKAMVAPPKKLVLTIVKREP